MEYDTGTGLCRVHDEQSKTYIKDIIFQLWDVRPVTFRIPCSNPVSLMRRDLPTIQQDYWVSLKADGVRMFLLLDMDKDGHEYSVFIDRAFNMYMVHVSGDASFFSGASLFDGELVQQGDSKQYILFNTIALKGYSHRGARHTANIETLSMVVASLTLNAPGIEARMRCKKWVRVAQLESLVSASAGPAPPVICDSTLPCDGLIFAPECGFLQRGTQWDTFKWKPPNLHTIDFLVDLECRLWLTFESRLVESNDPRVNVVAYTTENGRLLWQQWIPQQHTDMRLVECTCTSLPHNGGWLATPLKERLDKKTPNSIWVANATLQNIREHITLEELMSVSSACSNNFERPPSIASNRTQC